MPETKPSYEPEPPAPDSSKPSENSPDDFNELHDLRRRNARLIERIESLSEQLAQTESRLNQLNAFVSLNNEDLQPFGGIFMKPSAVTSVTFTTTGGVCINDHPIKTQHEVPTPLWEQMKQLVENINAQNAQRRQEAGLD